MKLIATYLSKQDGLIDRSKILVWPDSALIRSGKPVFLPEEDGKYMVHYGLGVKITGVGKSIMPKYSSRYYEGVAPVVFILRKEVSDKISHHEDPYASDLVEDFSVIVGEFADSDKGKDELELTAVTSYPGRSLPDTEETSVILDATRVLDEAVSTASRRNTLKTGDIVAFFIDRKSKPEINTVIRISVNGELLLENKIK